MYTHREASRRVASHRPSPATVQRRALLHEYPDDTASAERLWVNLALDLQRVKGEENLQTWRVFREYAERGAGDALAYHFANARQAASARQLGAFATEKRRATFRRRPGS